MSKDISAGRVESFTRMKIESLFNQSKTNSRPLAELRRGIGKRPGEIPQLWKYIFDTMPEEFYGNDEPSYAEWAVYTALTLYAMHQQGQDKNMYQHGQSIGFAMSRLASDKDAKERISKRFSMVATSIDMEELSHHIRGVIQLLKRDGIGLDYPKLARDLYLFQIPACSSDVKLRWGQDFYRGHSNNAVGEIETENYDNIVFN